MAEYLPIYLIVGELILTVVVLVVIFRLGRDYQSGAPSF